MLPVECTFPLEIVWVRVKIDFRFMLVGACYRPPSSSLAKFNEHLYNCLSALSHEFPNHIIDLGGAFNMPDIDWLSPHPCPGGTNQTQNKFFSKNS